MATTDITALGPELRVNAELSDRKKAVSAVVLAVVVLGGCGGSSDSNSGAQPPQAAASTPSGGGSATAPPTAPPVDRSASVAGNDSDANGIRDDLDHLVARLSLTPAERAGMADLARATRALLIAGAGGDSTAAAMAFDAQRRAMYCLNQTSTQAQTLIRRVAMLSVNTEARFDAWVQYEKQVSTQPLPSFSSGAC